MPEGILSRVTVVEVPVTPVARVLTSFRLLLAPVCSSMVQPEEQPAKVRVKGWPTSTWKETLVKEGLARAVAARAETAATEYFILKA